MTLTWQQCLVSRVVISYKRKKLGLCFKEYVTILSKIKKCSHLGVFSGKIKGPKYNYPNCDNLFREICNANSQRRLLARVITNFAFII